MKTQRMLVSGDTSVSTPTKLPDYPTTGALSTQSAWRILRRRTGGNVSRATFYRWVNDGKLSSIRLGFRIYVPLPALEAFIQKCMSGE